MYNNDLYFLARSIMKKWTQIRDSWMKCIKKQRVQKISGSSIKPLRLYICNYHLSFLKKVSGATIAHESIENTVSIKNRGRIK